MERKHSHSTRTKVEDALLEVLNRYNAGRAYVLEKTSDSQLWSYTFEVTAPGVLPLMNQRQNLQISTYSWWDSLISKQGVIVLNDVESLKRTAKPEYDLLKQAAAQSVLFAPLFREGGESMGFMCLDILNRNIEWTQDKERELLAYARMLSICMDLYRSNCCLEQNETIHKPVDKIVSPENLFMLISDQAKVGFAQYNMLKREGFAVKQWYLNYGEQEGTPLSQIIHIYNHVHPDDRKWVYDFYERALVGDGMYFKKDIRVERPEKPGEWNWTRVHFIVSHFDLEHANIEIISLNYDITELKEIEQRLIMEREKAEAADKLKSAFIANMSHEIRTPLNSIVGFSSLIAEAETPEEKQMYLDLVRSNNELLISLVTDIIDLSKIEAGMLEFSKKEMDVNLLCEDVLNSMCLKTKKEVPLCFDRYLPECTIVSDRNRLKQVLTNFVNNAIKFTKQGYIRIGYKMMDPTHICIYVADTGIGIPADKQATVFDRFVKLNSFMPGTGLGLSICKSIIDQLGGIINVSSEEGKGSCFYFILPVDKE